MRYLSLAVVIALLFSHFAVALPTRAGKGSSQPSSRPSVKSQVIGKNHPSAGGKNPKTAGQIKAGDIVGVKVMHHVGHFSAST